MIHAGMMRWAESIHKTKLCADLKVILVGLRACLCCSRVLSECHVCRKNLIPKWSRDLFTILINCTFCVPLAALIPSICLLEASGKGISLQNLSKQKVDRDADRFQPCPTGGVGRLIVCEAALFLCMWLKESVRKTWLAQKGILPLFPIGWGLS